MDKAKLFLSYSRQDQPLVRPLAAGLRQLRYDVWLDEVLTGGQAWWDSILEQIRRCDALLVAVSPTTLESLAVTREYEYAQALRRPVVPVVVADVHRETLPPRLALLHLVDYTTGATGAFELAAALTALPPAPPLPPVLPEPPPVPLSYLSELSHRIKSPALTLEEQLALVARLKGALTRPAERGPAVDLLRALEQRQDLFHATAQEIQRMIATEQPAEVPPPSREWSAEVLDASPTYIKLKVKRHDTHLVEYKYGATDTAWLDGKLVGRLFFDGTLKFTISDGSTTAHAEFTAVSTAILGTIKKLRLEIDGNTVYKFDR